MLDILQRFEERLVRLEAGLLVALVLLMLLLAVYNVFYRNVLVPAQVTLTTVVVAAGEAPPAGGPGSEQTAPEVEVEVEQAGPAEADEGFGGGFGDEEGEGEGEGEEPADEGFGGGFGEESGEEPADEGFGGGFGGDGDEKQAEALVERAEAQRVEAEIGEAEPRQVVLIRDPEEGSLAALLDDLIDAVKLEWIDVLLRQLVLIVGFLGAMLATHRRKHITVDALSKILPERALGWVHVMTNALSVVICALLAAAGRDLVKIGLAFPKELMHWADEWVFQLAFPIGFGLLTLHFLIRLFEAIKAARLGVPPARISTVPSDEPSAPSAGLPLTDGGAS